MELFPDQRNQVSDMEEIEDLFSASSERHITQAVCSMDMRRQPCTAFSRPADLTAAVQNHIVRKVHGLKLFGNPLFRNSMHRLFRRKHETRLVFVISFIQK